MADGRLVNGFVVVVVSWMALAIGFVMFRWPGVLGAALILGIMWTIRRGYREAEDDFDGGLEWEG